MSYTHVQGDSGGPLYVSPSTTMLLGVTSFVSSLGCQAGKPACFTSVPKYRNWIIATSKATKSNAVDLGFVVGLISLVQACVAKL